MGTTDTDRQIAKLRWQLQTLAQTMTEMDGTALARFIIRRDISQEDLTKLHSVFESCDRTLEKGEKIDWDSVEKMFAEALPGREDMTLPEVIYAFYDGNRWVRICKEWVDRND